MARTTNEFGGGEIVPAIEAITGIQAPVMADFVNSSSTTGTNPTLSAADIVALNAITVRTDNGEPRSIQNPKNNLKSSSGIERIPFNGIDELDTEQGPNGETVHALNTGDSRIRFINGTRQWQLFVDTTSGGTQPGTAVRLFNSSNGTLNVVMGSVEITFFGTALNILSWTDTNPTNWVAFVDGSTTGTQISPNNIVANATNPAQIDVTANRSTKVNQVVPVVSGLTAGIHTVRIEGRESGTGTNIFPLFGCEVINSNAAITQQPGEDFDGRVKLLEGTTLPIKPTGFSGTTGARVLNYLTSGGQLKQSFTESVESVVEAGGQGTTYQVQLSTPGTTGTLTIPAGAETIRVITFGGGTGGSGTGGTPNSFGGGGGARAEVIYTRNSGNTSTLALTSSIGAAGGDTTASLAATLVATAGGAGNANGGGSGFPGPGGTPTIPTSDPGIAGWTRTSTTEFTGGSGQSNTASFAGGAGGGVGGNTASSATFPNRGDIPLFPLIASSEVATFRAEGSGGGQTSSSDGLDTTTGAIPGGGGSGAGGTAGNAPPLGTGARGETYVIYTLTSANAADPVTNGTFTSANAQAIGTPREIFGATEHRDQEVIRRINFREFGSEQSVGYSKWN